MKLGEPEEIAFNKAVEELKTRIEETESRLKFLDSAHTRRVQAQKTEDFAQTELAKARDTEQKARDFLVSLIKDEFTTYGYSEAFSKITARYKASIRAGADVTLYLKAPT